MKNETPNEVVNLAEDLAEDAAVRIADDAPEKISHDGDKNLIGRVAAPPQLEATPDGFYFWVARNLLVEQNQFVRTESIINRQTRHCPRSLICPKSTLLAQKVG